MMMPPELTSSGGSTVVIVTGMLLAAVAPTLLALGALIYAKAASLNTRESKQEIVVLKEHINSRMTELLERTKQASYATGASEQRASMVAQPVSASADQQGDLLKAISDLVIELKKRKHV